MISIERVRFQQSLDALGQQGRQDFVDFLRDYHGEYLQLRVAGTGRMQQGGNIPDRNVAMSRMADMLGMKGLIAKSRKVRIKHTDADIPLQQEDAAKDRGPLPPDAPCGSQIRRGAQKPGLQPRHNPQDVRRDPRCEVAAPAGTPGAGSERDQCGSDRRERRRARAREEESLHGAAGAPAAEVPGANGAGGNTQNAAADGNEQNAGVNHKSSLADLLHEEDEQNLTRSMKHRRKVKISEAGEGPDDLMNSF